MKARQIQLWCLVVFLLAVAAIWLSPSQNSNASAEAKSPFKKLIDARARSATRETKTYRLPAMSADRVYSLLVSTPSPAAFGANDTLQVTLRGGGKTVAGKSLHAGDPDLYTLFRSNGTAEVEVVSFASTPIEYTVTVLEWPSTSTSDATVEAEPNDSLERGERIQTGPDRVGLGGRQAVHPAVERVEAGAGRGALRATGGPGERPPARRRRGLVQVHVRGRRAETGSFRA